MDILKKKNNEKEEVAEINLPKELNKYDYLSPIETSDRYSYLGEWRDLDPSKLTNHFDKKKAFDYARISHGASPFDRTNYNPFGVALIHLFGCGVVGLSGWMISKIIKLFIKDDNTNWDSEYSYEKMYFAYNDKTLEDRNPIYCRIDRPAFISDPSGMNHPIWRKITYIGLGIGFVGMITAFSSSIPILIKTIFGKNGLVNKPSFDDLHPQYFMPKYFNPGRLADKIGKEYNWIKADQKAWRNTYHNYTDQKIDID